MLPFAIVGSEDEIEVGGELVRARRYPWGIVQVDNPNHSDFLRLRTALLSTHLADLKEITHDVSTTTAGQACRIADYVLKTPSLVVLV